jgi:hypothetical protein
MMRKCTQLVVGLPVFKDQVTPEDASWLLFGVSLRKSVPSLSILNTSYNLTRLLTCFLYFLAYQDAMTEPQAKAHRTGLSCSDLKFFTSPMRLSPDSYRKGV